MSVTNIELKYVTANECSFLNILDCSQLEIVIA